MRVLLVEDDAQLRASLTRGFREAAWTVQSAANGTQALSLAAAGGFDAIVLDILLPGMDGIAVCRAIRAQGNEVPILMLTALDAVEHRIAGLDAGADDYLAKPFDFGELLARLRALTRRRGERAAAPLRVGDLVLDARRRRVRRGERTIALTAREFAFLHYLAQHAGRVVSRAELMAHVWDDTQHAYSNIIDVYASRLRRKLDTGDGPTLLSTQHGIGYLLETPATATTAGPARARKGPSSPPKTPRTRG